MNKYFIIVAIIVNLFLQIYTTFTFWENFSVSLFVFYTLYFVDNFGKQLVILDVVNLMAIFICLIMPIYGYHHFTATNLSARTWTLHMRVPSAQYYAFMIPAMLAMIFGMKIPIFYRDKVYRNHVQYLTNAKLYVSKMRWQGIILVSIGLFATLINRFVPAGLGTVTYLLRFTMFVGMFYCVYSDFPYKKLVLFVVFGLLLVQALAGGMFGELIFMSVISIIQGMLGRKIKFSVKLLLLFASIFGLLILQSVKPAFRNETWRGKGQGRQGEIFLRILQEKLSDPASVFNNDKSMFAFYGRFNQGQIVSRVINNVPDRFAYANGETIFLSLAGSVVPRFVWPDKPEAGGAANFERFVGIKLRGYTIGLSPFGEAYGNFGLVGGVIFMLFFGLFFNLVFNWLLKLAINLPSLIFWFPFIFFYAVQIESDVVTMINSLSKFALLTYLYYKFFPKIFKLEL